MSNINQQVIERIAKVCHEANRAYCAAMGDLTQPSWADAPEWQKSSAINGVRFHIENPDATPENSHESWLKQKQEEGWTYGPVKDAEKKEHPCFVPYADLPVEQKAKDYIFRAIIHAMYTPTVLMGSENHHGCSYYCKRPECVRRQRDELRDRMESVLAQRPTPDKFVASFRCESDGMVGSKDAPIHSVVVHDDGVIEVVIDYWPKQPAAPSGALSKLGPNQGPAGTPRIGPGSEDEA